jgi:hypothetical protein
MAFSEQRVEFGEGGEPRRPQAIKIILRQGDTHMECYHLMQYRLLLDSEVDMDDVVLGQLLTLVTGLTVVLLGRVLYLVF